ncbi:hypothetical protein BH18ACI2_BH18ACI2_06610 [soil metagenome]
MRQTVEAIIDCEGRVQLMEKISIARTRRALVTILEEIEDESGVELSTRDVSASIVGSLELLSDDLEAVDKEISQIFGDALLQSGENLGR